MVTRGYYNNMWVGKKIKTLKVRRFTVSYITRCVHCVFDYYNISSKFDRLIRNWYLEKKYRRIIVRDIIIFYAY